MTYHFVYARHYASLFYDAFGSYCRVKPWQHFFPFLYSSWNKTGKTFAAWQCCVSVCELYQAVAFYSPLHMWPWLSHVQCVCLCVSQYHVYFWCVTSWTTLDLDQSRDRYIWLVWWTASDTEVINSWILNDTIIGTFVFHFHCLGILKLHFAGVAC